MVFLDMAPGLKNDKACGAAGLAGEILECVEKTYCDQIGPQRRLRVSIETQPMKRPSIEHWVIWVAEALALCLSLLVAFKLIEASVTGAMHLGGNHRVPPIEAAANPSVFAFNFALLLAGEVLLLFGAWPMIRRLFSLARANWSRGTSAWRSR